MDTFWLIFSFLGLAWLAVMIVYAAYSILQMIRGKKRTPWRVYKDTSRQRRLRVIGTLAATVVLAAAVEILYEERLFVWLPLILVPLWAGSIWGLWKLLELAKSMQRIKEPRGEMPAWRLVVGLVGFALLAPLAVAIILTLADEERPTYTPKEVS